MPINRRDFLKGAAGVGGAVLIGQQAARAGGLLSNTHVATAITDPGTSGIEHIVVLCMENRSFDHMLGWIGGSSGVQSGLTYLDDAGTSYSTYRLDEWTGCGFNDPGHGYDEGRVQWNNGACDGFMKNGSGNDVYALGYYTEDQLPTSSYLVRNFAVCDHWYASILGPTYPNRFYTHSAATDRTDNNFNMATMPSIWDGLQAKGVSCAYYFSDLPFIGLYGPKFAPISHNINKFFVDALAGTLPAYSYLDPFFLGEGQGGSNDDHPHADIRRGQNFIGRVVDAVMKSPVWGSTVLIITYDEWGGFFDHVNPPAFPDNDATHAQAGFRVPAYIVSPFAPRGAIDNTPFEHSAILKFVEWRFGLDPMTPRDAASNNIATILDASRPNLNAPSLAVPADPGPDPCTGEAQLDSMWHDLKQNLPMDAYLPALAR